MSTLSVVNIKGQSVGEVKLAEGVLAGNRGGQALHEAVVAYRANQRRGTASTKGKGEVAGSGKKPWRQKGTGRARAGYKQSPVWRGGSVVFGPKPRDFSKKITRKTAKLALRRAFSERVTAGEVTVVDAFAISAPKTKEFVSALRTLKAGDGALVVLDQVGQDITRASRNVPSVEVVAASNVNVYQLIRHKRIVISRPALDALQSRLAAQEREAS